MLSHDISIDEDGGAKPTTIRLTENEYNELSQVIEKKLHSTNFQNFLQNVDYKYNIRGWLTDINDIEFGTITATELQDQLVNGLVAQVTNGNIEIEMNVAELESGNRDRVEVREGTEEEVLELEENPTTTLVTALTDAINIGDLGTINESNIDLALETLRTQLETGLTNVGVTETTARGMIEDEVMGFYQNEWLRTVANDNDNDLFAMHFDYTQSNSLLNATGQYNGNITGMTWRVRGQNKKAYSLEYDNLNRLTSADYIEIDDNNQIVTASQDGYNMAASYDLNGNIETMYRKGATTVDANGLATAFGVIDNMTYIYGSNSNELQKIYETTTGGSNSALLNSKGFKDNGMNIIDYTYDANGNVTYDANKDVTITYNHLNLPIKFYWSSNQYIDITYDAAGVKLTKTKYLNGTTTIKDYIGGIEYNNNDLEAVSHAEGRAVYNDPNTSTQGEINNFTYEYSIKDHLGNSRVMFSDLNGNGQVTESEIIQAEHYYPFGMSMEGHGTPILSETDYKYNGKELNADFGLDLYDYGARWYDASVGRWHGVDPLAEAFIVHSPYNYGVNNPIMMVDPDGRASQCAMCSGNVSGYKTGAEQSVNFDRKMEHDRRKKEHADKTHSTVTNEDGSTTDIKNSDIAGSFGLSGFGEISAYGTRWETTSGKILQDIVEGYNVTMKDGRVFDLADIQNSDIPFLKNDSDHSIWFKPDDEMTVEGKLYEEPEGYELKSGRIFLGGIDGIAAPHIKSNHVLKVVDGVKLNVNNEKIDWIYGYNFKRVALNGAFGGWKNRTWVYGGPEFNYQAGDWVLHSTKSNWKRLFEKSIK